MKTTMKIIIVLPFLSGIGGIQSSLLNLLNNIQLSQNEVSICVFGNYISDSTIIPAGIKIIKGPRLLEYSLRGIASACKSYSWLERMQCVFVKIVKKIVGYKKIMNIALKLYKIEGNYDIAIAYSNDIHYATDFVGGGNDLVRTCITAKRKIAWIHNEAHRHGLTKNICKNTYKDFDNVVNVSYACKKIFDGIIPEYEFKSKVVYNMFNIEKIKELAREKNPYNTKEFNLVTVARIDNQQKRIDRVLDCCERLKTTGYKGFKWYVVGDGPDLPYLMDKAKEKKLEDILIFTGRKNNPYPYMKYADVLVMTSDYEAHGMVLTESLLVGTPTICTNYPAAAEIVEEGVNGVIVGISTEALFNEVKKVMGGKNILQQWRENIAHQEINNEVALKQFWSVVNGNA